MTPLQQKWITKLLGLDYDIQYKKGCENGAADALSRREGSNFICSAISMVVPKWIKQILQSYTHDSYIEDILTTKVLNPSSKRDFQVVEGLIRYKGRIAVGNHSNFRELLFVEMHLAAYGGHSGAYVTYIRLKRHFFWPELKEDINKWVQHFNTLLDSIFSTFQYIFIHIFNISSYSTRTAYFNFSTHSNCLEHNSYTFQVTGRHIFSTGQGRQKPITELIYNYLEHIIKFSFNCPDPEIDESERGPGREGVEAWCGCLVARRWGWAEGGRRRCLVAWRRVNRCVEGRGRPAA